MNTFSSSRPGQLLLLFLPIVAVMGALFAAIPWLSEQSDTLIWSVAAAAALFVIAYGLAMSRRRWRQSDEIERAQERFAIQVGQAAGSAIAVVLLMLPPLQSLIVDAANRLGTGSVESSDRESVLLGVIAGFLLLALAQGVCAMIASLYWQWRAARPLPEQPSGSGKGPRT